MRYLQCNAQREYDKHLTSRAKSQMEKAKKEGDCIYLCICAQKVPISNKKLLDLKDERGLGFYRICKNILFKSANFM